MQLDMGIKIQGPLYNKSRYAEVDGSIYKIERTYINGMFIELYLTESNIKKSDIIGYAWFPLWWYLSISWRL